MWQLTVLAKAARLTNKLENHLPHKLRTAQLILVHGQPLSITFRTEKENLMWMGPIIHGMKLSRSV
jgi:hypothetical protein